MNLVDLLAWELESWPSAGGVECGYIVQEVDGELYSTHNMPPIYKFEGIWDRNVLDDGECGYFMPAKSFILATDHSTAIITREMWQAARDKLKGETKVPKANKDGWIRHRGGKCPVADDVMVQIVMRCESKKDFDGKPHKASEWDWTHTGLSYDLMYYRVVEAEQVSLASAASDGELWSDAKEMPATKPIDGPLQWRDRIHALDAATKEEEARHCADMDAYDKERAELVDKLKAEGLALIEREEVVQEDWRNWEVDDLVTYVGINDSNYYVQGRHYQVEALHDDGFYASDEYEGHHLWSHSHQFKWHSRPTK